MRTTIDRKQNNSDVYMMLRDVLLIDYTLLVLLEVLKINSYFINFIKI